MGTPAADRGADREIGHLAHGLEIVAAVEAFQAELDKRAHPGEFRSQRAADNPLRSKVQYPVAGIKNGQICLDFSPGKGERVEIFQVLSCSFK